MSRKTLRVGTEYVRRPLGFQGVNDAWICNRCLKVGSLDEVFQRHGKCPGQFALALITKKKADRFYSRRKA